MRNAEWNKGNDGPAPCRGCVCAREREMFGSGRCSPRLALWKRMASIEDGKYSWRRALENGNRFFCCVRLSHNTNENDGKVSFRQNYFIIYFFCGRLAMALELVCVPLWCSVSVSCVEALLCATIRYGNGMRSELKLICALRTRSAGLDIRVEYNTG